MTDANPIRLQDIDFDDDQTKTSKGDQLLLYNLSPNGDSMLIFASLNNLS